MFEMKQGNQFSFVVSVTDVDGNALTTLATASAILCMVKNSQSDADADALISKTVGSGITVDSPNTGDLTIVFDPADSINLSTGNKYIAVQIEYASGNEQEIQLKFSGSNIDKIELKSDVIRS
jgi:hypothetical protein